MILWKVLDIKRRFLKSYEDIQLICHSCIRALTNTGPEYVLIIKYRMHLFVQIKQNHFHTSTHISVR